MAILEVADLVTRFDTPGGPVNAVDGVSFALSRGESLGLVGESGCGKSTLGRTILRLIAPSAGRIRFDGHDITGLGEAALKPVRRQIQMIFQDPFASLNPRHRIGEILATPLKVHGVGNAAARMAAVHAMLESVGLSADAALRFPHEFSGGQRQRIGIARALILGPEVLICDEPVSALDLSIQAQILNLLAAMKARSDLSLVFISHDLSVVRYFTDRVMVMYLGRIVEVAPANRLWTQPAHPYTRALIDALPDPSRRRTAPCAHENVLGSQGLPRGCRYSSRCPLATEICRTTPPHLREIGEDHQVECHHV